MLPMQDALSPQRQSYMAALSLAETIMSETNVLPADFAIVAYPWAPTRPELRFYFHRDVPALRQFRDEQMLTESMTTRDDGSVHIEASRDDVRGVRVVAWTLTRATAAAVTA
ncbi:hypothetical protein [Streptomyces sp. MMS20-AI2-20]|uniref:hypothetical protein n=1 Tax=Streptomyces sp. MMS20-AI2-20 TaxID=2925835 RepID=UPI001F61D2BA|nr:hypothetical protein [Streptomyces sp. MMS20-AI2-20]MCI4143016.1 hypothetical protein [Streptomyces sp. MMS20-AI2-20]